MNAQSSRFLLITWRLSKHWELAVYIRLNCDEFHLKADATQKLCRVMSFILRLMPPKNSAVWWFASSFRILQIPHYAKHLSNTEVALRRIVAGHFSSDSALQQHVKFLQYHQLLLLEAHSSAYAYFCASIILHWWTALRVSLSSSNQISKIKSIHSINIRYYNIEPIIW